MGVQVVGTVEDLATELVRLPDDAPIRADLLLESVVEGILPVVTPAIVGISSAMLKASQRDECRLAGVCSFPCFAWYRARSVAYDGLLVLMATSPA